MREYLRGAAVIRVPVPHTRHVAVLIDECDCVDGSPLADNPPLWYGIVPEYYDHLHEAYVSFMVHHLRRYRPPGHPEGPNEDGERYWAVHWGDAHLVAVRDRP